MFEKTNDNESIRYVNVKDHVWFKGEKIPISVHTDEELQFLQGVINLAENSGISYGRAIGALKNAADLLEACSAKEVIKPKK